MHVLERTQSIETPLSEVFTFFSDPRNLARITPPWLEFRVVAPVETPLREGSRFEYRIRWSVLNLGWVTRITRWQPPREFQDIQEKGPYRTWIHTHRFTEGAGGVTMHDHVTYELPLGPLGRLVHRVRVRRQLEQIFDFRRRSIAALFGGERPGA